MAAVLYGPDLLAVQGFSNNSVLALPMLHERGPARSAGHLLDSPLCMHCHTASHATAACSPSQAYAPQYPVPKEERWYFLLADPSVVRGSPLMDGTGTKGGTLAAAWAGT